MKAIERLNVKDDIDDQVISDEIKNDSWNDDYWTDEDTKWKSGSDESDKDDRSVYSKEDKMISKSSKRKQDKSGLCPKCGKVTLDIRSHLKSHSTMFSCDLCLINFKNEKLLKEHREVHDTDNPYNCDFCNMIFKNITKLALHRFVHTKTYACPLCGFIATSKFRNSIIAHIKRHEDNYTVRCDLCKKGFLCKKKLEEHMEWHENIPKYECEICHKKFPVKSYLQLHNKFNHKKELYGTEEIFQCELCGRKFTFEKSFKRHLSCIHKIGKDFTVKCPVCHKIIANNHNLKKHMRVHTGERNYSCDTCGKTFSQKQYVTRHQKVHRAERENTKRPPDGDKIKLEHNMV
ncbi:zinc finger protein 83-like [Sitophilus oryzae]|uniref:Zinc finger protein 83-like n=1 Tax=Sitophilus oryzae TaxID=7048 RepID=A0A6J2XN08_SITOR|nr:zinc finger protein 83-like [Sitophilus oryzae]